MVLSTVHTMIQAGHSLKRKMAIKVESRVETRACSNFSSKYRPLFTLETANVCIATHRPPKDRNKER